MDLLFRKYSGFSIEKNPSDTGFPRGSAGKESACSVGDLGSISGLGRFPEGGPGNPLQYSCLENPMDRRARQATVHEVAKSQTHAQGRQECLKPLQVVALSVP